MKNAKCKTMEAVAAMRRLHYFDFCSLLFDLSVASVFLLSFCTGARARDPLSASGVEGGLVVHVGGDNAQRLTAWAAEGFVVQGLSRDPSVVAKMRRHLQAAGKFGRVSVGPFDGTRLPYVDSLVNVLVISEPGRLRAEEVVRVLVPGGTAFVEGASEVPGLPTAPIESLEGWKAYRKPWPPQIDEWTHYLHGPDNNAVADDEAVGPPRSMQWVGSPRWSRNHHKLCSISAVVTARGRLFCIMDDAPAANINLPGQWMLVARDAFNGVELWRKPMASWAWHGIRFRSGPPQLPRLLVACEDRVYAPLGLNAPVSAIEAGTGKTLDTFADTAGAEEIILADGVLLVLKGAPVAEQATKHASFSDRFRMPNEKALVAVAADSGRTLWRWSDPNIHPAPETLACRDGRVYLQATEGVLCLDLRSGEPRWMVDRERTEPRRRVTFGRHVLVVADGVVLCTMSDALVALDAEDGRRLWDCPAEGGFHSPADVFVIDGLVWHGSHPSDSISPPPVHDFSEGRDLRTGRVVRTNQVMVDLQTEGHHHRCYREKATSRYILAGKRGIEMMDLRGKNHSRNNWVRGACQYGILPANGLIYAPPHACGCYMESKLYGFWALAAERARRGGPRAPDAQRLEKGPAYARPVEPEPDDAESWPQYRHDALRSGVAKTAVPAKLQRAWRVEVGSRLTPPVVAGGRVLVADMDTNTVYALDQGTGKTAWSYVAGGPVDSPPTVYRGMALFGSADGRVHCLRLRDGKLIWRFLAAPSDLRTVAEGRIESLWPVHGSVLLLDGIVYCSAGRSTWLDGGIDLYGLDPATGKVLCRRHFESRHPKHNEGRDRAKPQHVARIDQNKTDYKTFLAADRSDAFSMAAGSISDVLVSNGRDVFLHQAGFDAELEPLERMATHLFSTSSLLDDAENHRSHWVLGTGDFSRVPVAYSWIVNRPGSRSPTIAVPTGVMMVYDDESVWSVRRKGDSNGRYELFQREHAPLLEEGAESAAGGPDFRKISAEEAKACVWRTDLPVRTQGMLKSGDHLFLGVVPVEIPPDEPQAAYEGRRGGKIWVAGAKDGSQVAEYDLTSPVVWDGMAAAHGRLYFSASDGCVSCWAGGE